MLLVFSKSSIIVRLFLSNEIIHIKHDETEFQSLDEYLPIQFHHPNKKSITLSSETQEIPKDLKTKDHSW